MAHDTFPPVACAFCGLCFSPWLDGETNISIQEHLFFFKDLIYQIMIRKFLRFTYSSLVFFDFVWEKDCI